MTRSEATFVLSEVYEIKTHLRAYRELRKTLGSEVQSEYEISAARKVIEGLIGKLEKCRQVETPGFQRTGAR